MILSALNDYYARLTDDPDSGISPLGYSFEKISYAIVLDKAGNVVAVDDIRDTSGKKPIPKGLIVPQGEKRTAGIKSNFLWDKTNYVLGVSSDEYYLSRLEALEAKEILSSEENKEKTKLQKDKNQFEKGVKRLPNEHQAFKEFHRQELNGSCDEGLVALLSFLANWNPSNYSEHPAFSAHGEAILDANVVFKLDGENKYLHERAAVRALINKKADASEENKTSVCLVTGEQSALARLHPAIKGVNGAQSSGASIVSFNLDSFTSYGKKQGDNAPVSEQAAFAYTTALNHLLRRDDQNRQRLKIGDATVVFWAQADDSKQAQAAEDLFAEFIDPKDEDAQHTGRLRDALEKVRNGLPLSDLNTDLREDTQIFVLGLAPNASRLSIRFWETGSLKLFAQRLAAHYNDLQLEPSPWRTPPALWQLLLSTAPNRDGKAKSEDVPPQLAGELTRAILTGQRYPYSLLSTLIMRMRADGDEKAFGVRASLIKAILVRAKRLGQKIDNKGELPVSLDINNTDPGYLLGRLFAVLENIQRAALGKDVNATIRDKFYGAASATPASVFSVLVRNAQHHLSRLRKDKPGFAVNLEKELGDIFDLLGTTFPKNLNIEAQGHFAIGYYHQSKARFAGKDVQKGNEDTTDSEGDNA